MQDMELESDSRCICKLGCSRRLEAKLGKKVNSVTIYLEGAICHLRGQEVNLEHPHRTSP